MPRPPDGTPGQMCWVSLELGDWGSQWRCRRGGVQCQGVARAGGWLRRSGLQHMSGLEGPLTARVRGPQSAGLVGWGVGGAPGRPVLPLPGRLPAGGRVRTRQEVYGVVELGPL